MIDDDDPRFTFHDLQMLTREWRAKNFPGATTDEQFMGMVEELGELSHALLKHRQKIRGMEDAVAFKAAVMDAVGDLVIFACGLLDTLDLSLETAAALAWGEIRERDWQADPLGGKQQKLL